MLQLAASKLLATRGVHVPTQGDRVRIYFGNAGPNLISSFHIIGCIFDKVPYACSWPRVAPTLVWLRAGEHDGRTPGSVPPFAVRGAMTTVHGTHPVLPAVVLSGLQRA